MAAIVSCLFLSCRFKTCVQLLFSADDRAAAAPAAARRPERVVWSNEAMTRTGKLATVRRRMWDCQIFS